MDVGFGMQAPSPSLMFDFRTFGLSEMLRCGLELRRRSKGAATMEQTAEAATRFFYESFADPRTGEQACALVRFYKTHSYSLLEPSLQRFATKVAGGTAPNPGTKCLTLLATIGDDPQWCSRQTSRGHQAIPLLNVGMVAKAPMVAALIDELGLDLGAVLHPTPDVVRELEGKSYGVFYVADAHGSPSIPAQEEFVVRYGIQSVVGFGGMLPSGDIYATIMFSRVPVPAATADRFRTVALDLRAMLFQFREHEVFATRPASARSARVPHLDG